MGLLANENGVQARDMNVRAESHHVVGLCLFRSAKIAER